MVLKWSNIFTSIGKGTCEKFIWPVILQDLKVQLNLLRSTQKWAPSRRRCPRRARRCLTRSGSLCLASLIFESFLALTEATMWTLNWYEKQSESPWLITIKLAHYFHFWHQAMCLSRQHVVNNPLTRNVTKNRNTWWSISFREAGKRDLALQGRTSDLLKVK